MFRRSLAARVRRLWKRPDADLAAGLVARADAARDDGRFHAAAYLYAEAAELRPHKAGIRIQCGHMFKEIGKLEIAEEHYLAARKLSPSDADLWLQFGHFYKVAGKLDAAEDAYRKSVALKPGWDVPAGELNGLRRSRGKDGGPGDTDSVVGADQIPAGVHADLLHFDAEATGVRLSANAGRLSPKLVPHTAEKLLVSYKETIEVRRLGQRETSYWGVRRTVRGVQAIRGFCISTTPLLEVQIILNGIAIHRGSLAGGYVLPRDVPKSAYRKYVFNVWHDFSGFAPGLYAIEIRFLDVKDEVRAFHDRVVIAPAIAEADYPVSDALVSVRRDDARSVVEQIRARPSMVRAAKRELFPDGVRNVLVMRTDQLGDMVASIPAMIRLRELVPDARIVGLLTAANEAFARTLDLFDELIVIDFPDDPVEQRRVMPLDRQDALRRRLAPYRFDIALDLAQSNVSRELLQLAGARFVYGVAGEDWPFLTGEFMFNTHDRWNGMDIVPHSAKVLAMIEALGAVLRTHGGVLRRADLSPDLLRSYGIGPDDDFILLHAGARVIFSRWPHYPELAALILAESDLKVVMMTDDPLVRGTLPAELLASDRFLFLDQRLPFDHFDAFISFAKAMVGNDSGPKHLASLRGTNVITLFTARINWTEWGQENVGAVISRRVPCAGCAIFHDLEDCGMDFACIVDITPHEVLDALQSYL